MSSQHSDPAKSVAADMKGAARGIHGAGEAIPGTFNKAVDATFNDKLGEAKNRQIAEKGVADVKRRTLWWGRRTAWGVVVWVGRPLARGLGRAGWGAVGACRERGVAGRDGEGGSGAWGLYS
jgi:hypothetical protein